MLLRVSDLRAGYRNKEVLFGVSIGVAQGEIVTILGHNGAGKTTLLSGIHGLCEVFGGAVEYLDENITRNKTNDLVRKGLIFIPDGHQIFGELRVSENLRLIKYLVQYDRYDSRINDIFKIFPRLKERSTQIAQTLSGGEQQMLTIAMGLLMDPKLLMLDEPLVGLAPLIVRNLLDAMNFIRNEFNISILFVEQNVGHALSIADRLYIMKLGNILLESTAHEFGKQESYIDYF